MNENWDERHDEIRTFLETLYGRLSCQFEAFLSAIHEDEKPLIRMWRYRVFYSNPYVSLKEGDLYYMGFNPSADINRTDPYPLESADTWIEKPRDWNVIDDDEENWRSWKLKPNIGDVVGFTRGEMGGPCDYRDVLMTNLFFFRMPEKYNRFLSEFSEEADCWWCHEQMLTRFIRPKVVFCCGNEMKPDGSGNSAYACLYRLLRDNLVRDHEQHRIYPEADKWYFKSFVARSTPWGRRNVTVIGVPHMSRMHPKSRPIDNIKSEIRNLIKGKLRREFSFKSI